MTKIDITKNPLPAIIHPVEIKAIPPQGQLNQKIIIDGDLLKKAKIAGDGLLFTVDPTGGDTGGSSVRGLTIQNFMGNGIKIDNVSSCEIGGIQNLDQERCIIIGNTAAGVLITGKEAKLNSIVNCYIGTDGTNRKGNRNGVVVEGKADGNKIGDGDISHRNVISGNLSDGVVLQGLSTSTIVNGNYIGTDKDGSVAVANVRGVYINKSSKNTVGSLRPLDKGALKDPANIISGNANHGIVIQGVEDAGPGKTLTRRECHCWQLHRSGQVRGCQTAKRG